MYIQIRTRNNLIITAHVNNVELVHKTDVKRCTLSSMTQDNVEISLEEYKRVVEELKKLNADIMRQRTINRGVKSRI